MKIKGAASRLLANWVGPFKVVKVKDHKMYELQHIDTGNIVTQTVTNMHAAPEPLYDEEYSTRYSHVIKLAPPDLESIHEGVMVLVNTERVGVVPAKVLQIMDDGNVLVDWYNGCL